jgi:hypothetical protein
VLRVAWLADDDGWINVFGFSKLFTCQFQVGYFAHNGFRLTYARVVAVLKRTFWTSLMWSVLLSVLPKLKM